MDQFLELRPIDWVIIGIASCSYLPIGFSIIRQDGEGQSFTTWFLWFLLDCVSCIIAIQQQKSYAMTIAFVIGALAMSILMLTRKQKIIWKGFDTFISVLVALSFIAWVYSIFVMSGDLYWATIFSTIAQMIAGIPLLRKTWEKPDLSSLPSYIGFWITNIITVYIAPTWTVPYIFFAGTFAIYNIFFILPLVIKIFQRKEKRSAI